MANLLTLGRIVCALLLLFFSVDSPGFMAFYLLGGMTDMADGLIARKTHTETALGAKLDSAADVLFLLAAGARIVPVLPLDGYWLSAIAGIAALRVVCLVKNRKWVSHSPLNRAAGLLLFLLPMTLSCLSFRVSGALVCAVATAAAIFDIFGRNEPSASSSNRRGKRRRR